jgi:hypothetical protein
MCIDIVTDVNIDLGPSCGERFRLGRPSDYACALSAHVHNALIRYCCYFATSSTALCEVCSSLCTSQSRSCGATEFINKQEACIQVRCSSTVQVPQRCLHSFLIYSFAVRHDCVALCDESGRRSCRWESFRCMSRCCKCCYFQS